MTRWILLSCFAARLLAGAAVEAWPEYLRPDPFGGVVKPDRAATDRSLALAGARGGYVSCHLVVKASGPYALSVNVPASLQADLYREWFHFTDKDKSYYPDALVPVKSPYRSQIPEPDNKVPNQTAQGFWLDVWVPKDARPGTYKGSAIVETGGRHESVPLEIKVLPATVPDKDVVLIDHNSYGKLGTFERTHAYYRLFYEHRGVFHNLGYGHGGKVGPDYAPELEGSGRKKHVASWDRFDQHYGALLDGSAFAGTRRGPRPIPFVYLPINPEWPASFLWWGEPGYEVEFVNVVSEMERHFREKGWTGTNFEMFFNHKKRYKAFDWDGDETRFAGDLPYYKEYARLLHKAVPAGSPVHFVFRADASWTMERQFRELAGMVNMWVCGGEELSWYRDSKRMIKDRGDIVFYYGGAPPVSKAASEITLNPLKSWIWGIDGYVHWQVNSAGRDPWFHFDGGETMLVYPGERFGVQGLLASLRLKIQRNAVQDIDLLDSFKSSRPVDELRREAARRYNGSSPDDWWTPRPAMADRNPEEWTQSDWDSVPHPGKHFFENPDPAAFQNVHRLVVELAEAK